MAIVWADGFDHWGTAANMLAGGYAQAPGNPSTTNPRTGSYCLVLNDIYRRVLDTSATKIGVCLATYLVGKGGDIIRLERLVGTNSVILRFNADLSISIVNNGTVVATSAPNTYILNTYQQWEIKADLTGGNGTHSIAVRRNGVATNIIEANGLTILGPMVAVSIGGATVFGSRADDFVIWDGTGTKNNDWLADRKCFTSFPTSNGTLQQWTPNTGNAWDNLDNVPPGANYISSATAGDISEFNKTAVTALTTSIAAISIYAATLKTDAGPAGYRLGMNKGGVVQNGPVINPGTTVSFGKYIMESDPDGISWTRATLDGATVRITRDV